MKALEVKNVSKNFEGFKVLKNISFSIEPGQRRAIIGPNGAGKTTLFNVISGTLPLDEGEIIFFDKNIHSLKSFQRARLGYRTDFSEKQSLSKPECPGEPGAGNRWLQIPCKQG